MATEISKPEIDNHIMKLIVGVIALTLAWLTSYFSSGPLASISESYYEEGWSRDIFVGFLFAISAFLVAYNGLDWPEEMVLAKIAAVAALFVAMFPCDCGRNNEIIPYVHFISAAVMFLVLAVFCWIFYRRARTKPYREARGRAAIYLVCGAVIVLAVVVLAYDGLTGNSLSAKVERDFLRRSRRADRIRRLLASREPRVSGHHRPGRARACAAEATALKSAVT